MPATISAVSPTVVAMCAAGVTAFVIGTLAARREIAGVRGLEKIVALATVCVAVPLAVFGALHLFGARFVVNLVPAYMPWRLFWSYLVGCALLAASLSMATRTAVGWSGLLLGVMMFLFVAMIHVPGALRQPHDRIIWTIVFREMSFGGAAWMLAGVAMSGRRQSGHAFVLVGRALVTMAMIVFGVEHFLHPMGLPGVPLVKQMPAWLPGRAVIDYLTGGALLLAAASSIINRQGRAIAAMVGGWLLLLIVVIYVPVMVTALADPRVGTQLEGVNYFADTLLFTGAILALARATPRQA
jgi:uncharacterized membrane protein